VVGQIPLKKVRLSSGSEDRVLPLETPAPFPPPIPDPDPEGGPLALLPLPLGGEDELEDPEEPEFPDTDEVVKAE